MRAHAAQCKPRQRLDTGRTVTYGGDRDELAEQFGHRADASGRGLNQCSRNRRHGHREVSVQEADACAVHGERQLQRRPPGCALGRRRSAASCKLIRDVRGRRLPTETRLACLIPQRDRWASVAELRAEHSSVLTPGSDGACVVQPAHAASCAMLAGPRRPRARRRGDRTLRCQTRVQVHMHRVSKHTYQNGLRHHSLKNTK